jgi:hypothetical protein
MCDSEDDLCLIQGTSPSVPTIAHVACPFERAIGTGASSTTANSLPIHQCHLIFSHEPFSVCVLRRPLSAPSVFQLHRPNCSRFYSALVSTQHSLKVTNQRLGSKEAMQRKTKERTEADSRLQSMMGPPKAMRQQVCESHEHLPPSGRLGESTIESCVDHQILAKGPRNRPEITDGVALLEWL